MPPASRQSGPLRLRLCENDNAPEPLSHSIAHPIVGKRLRSAAAEYRHDFAREKLQRPFAGLSRNSRNREPADKMARAQLSLKSDDFLNTRRRVGQDNPVFGEALNGNFARRALDHGVRPPEVHLLECLNKIISRSTDGVFGTACDKDVAKQGDIAFAFSCLSACLPIHLQARCDLVEARRRPNQPGVSKARGAANRRLCPGAKPDRRSRPLHRPRRHRDIVHLIILSAVSDILLRPEAGKKGNALLPTTAPPPCCENPHTEIFPGASRG